MIFMIRHLIYIIYQKVQQIKLICKIISKSVGVTGVLG